MEAHYIAFTHANEPEHELLRVYPTELRRQYVPMATEETKTFGKYEVNVMKMEYSTSDCAVGRESSFHISEHDGGRVIVDTIENDNTKKRRGWVGGGSGSGSGNGSGSGSGSGSDGGSGRRRSDSRGGDGCTAIFAGWQQSSPSKKRSIEIASTPGHSIIVWCESMDNSSSKRFQSAATPKRKSSACEGGSIAKSNFAELPAE